MELTNAQDIDFNYENIKDDKPDGSGFADGSCDNQQALEPILAIQPKQQAQNLITRFLSRAFPVSPSLIRIKSKSGQDMVISNAMLALSLKRKINMCDRINC